MGSNVLVRNEIYKHSFMYLHVFITSSELLQQVAQGGSLPKLTAEYNEQNQLDRFTC